ncbi:hypothetical protein [Vibrio parahaemolyticus]|uniref:hypothetical protein n=1 Tax=Vibrio parahaemolyticus TaxID=670 RepID=UPI00226B0161|nr:hypothetical protein [Vibrio parahaemolyticus]MCX8914777.1 hypothetical protein [Vibrio parahaemolyticus]
MSELKNHYGDNVAWFCAEATAALSDMAGDGMLDSSFELYSEDEQGREGFVEIKVLKLFESASVVIEEKDVRINALTNQRDRLIKLLEGLERVTDIWLPANVDKEFQGEAEALHAFRSEYLSALEEIKKAGSE